LFIQLKHIGIFMHSITLIRHTDITQTAIFTYQLLPLHIFTVYSTKERNVMHT